MTRMLLGGLLTAVGATSTGALAGPPPAVQIRTLGDPAGDAFAAVVQMGDRAVPALRDAACGAPAGEDRGRSVLVLQEIGTALAQAALVDVSRCAADTDPPVHQWAVVAAARLTTDPAVLAVLWHENGDDPALASELEARAVDLWKGGDLRTSHWLVAPGGDSGWATALAARRPHIVPVRALARAMARHPDPRARAYAADVLLALPPGYRLGDALVAAYQFDSAAAAMPWTGRPEVGRFTLSATRSRRLASELIPWLITSPMPLDRDLAEVTWGFVPRAAQALGEPATRADWLHLWGAFAPLSELEVRLPVALLPSSLESAWASEVALQHAEATSTAAELASAATRPSAILRRRAHQALQDVRRAPRRRALRAAYRVLWERLDDRAGPRAYADVAAIVAEGGADVRWRDVAPLGHRLVERYVRADRFDQWSAMLAYEDGLLDLQDAYDAGGTIPRCCGDGWLYWLGRVDGRATVRRRVRTLGLQRVPHFATLVQNQQPTGDGPRR